jgi:hypothetical protein
MKIPYVIDNQTSLLTDVLRQLLTQYKGQSLDTATAYFTIRGYNLLRAGLEKLGNFRLILGAEPRAGEQLGLKPDAKATLATMRADLDAEPFAEETLGSVEDLIRFLRRENVAVRLYDKGFLHAKCWLFYSDRPGQQMLFERFRPVVAIVGSSNFTVPGLTSNRELNLAHKVLLDESEAEDRDAQRAVAWLSDEKPSERVSQRNRQLIKSEVGARAIIELEEWFERQWAEARDFKEDLIELLDASKFGQKEYTPYQVYMKALYEYFKDDLGAEIQPVGRTAVDLAEFQEDAVKKARRILARYDGVMIADSVGLGKTWIGKKLLEDFAYHMRQKAIVICPASLRKMWDDELKDAAISATILSQEEVGQADFPAEHYADADIVLVDESHNFRNRNAQRYDNLERLISMNGGRGREGLRKKIVLITATPINNDLFDLHNQISLFTQGDKGYFSAAGIGDLHRYFLRARRERDTGSSTAALFNLLEEVVIRRTRPFIKRAYPNAVIRKKQPDGMVVEQKITFPDRRLRTVKYNLEATYRGIYEEVVNGIEKLRLAPYNLESYKKAGVEVDEFEQGREEALVGIFKSRFLKRFESSIEAFRISVRRGLEFQKTFESYILGGKVLRSTDFQRVMRYLSREDEEDDATPISRAEEFDAAEEAHEALESLEVVDPAQYDLRKLHEAVQQDVEILTSVWQCIKDIRPNKDAKLQRLKELLSGELRGKKVLIFSYYKDTARYLYEHIGHPDKPEAQKFRAKIGNPVVRRMDSGADPKERTRLVEGFAPKANDRPEWLGTDKEIDILISTDVLSEGQNPQDCGHLVNFDLHWNPTRMVQRAGRIDRIGTEFDTLWICNMFPDEGLERLLGLVERLSEKISDIDRAGFLDASVLGEVVHPRNFNTLRRIRDEDGAVIEEQEQFMELASNEFLLQQLRSLLEAGGKEMLDSLPDGIHSGLVKRGAKGVFFYFQAPGPKASGKLHFWKYYDLKDNRIIDNRFVIANLIACEKDTPRVVGDYDVFGIQEKVIEDILKSHEKQQALQAAPKTVDPLQQTVATVVQGYLNHPDVKRGEAIEAIRFLSQPMPSVQVKELRRHYQRYQADNLFGPLLDGVLGMRHRYGVGEPRAKESPRFELKRENLRLICFDHLCS